MTLPVIYSDVQPYSKSYHFEGGDEFLFRVDSTNYTLHFHCVRDDSENQWVTKQIGFPVLNISSLQTTQHNIEELHKALPDAGIVEDNSLIVSQSVCEFVPDEIVDQLPKKSAERGRPYLKIPFKLYPFAYRENVQPMFFEEKPTEMKSTYYLQTDPYIRFQKLHPIEQDKYSVRHSVTQKQFHLSQSCLEELENVPLNKCIL